MVVPPAVRVAGRLTGVEEAEQQFEGGLTNAGQVVRVGAHVLRPSRPHSRSVHAFLKVVSAAGFEGAPVPVAIDKDGRERLVFIDDDVPTTPYPPWGQSDEALASVALLLRGLHDAASASIHVATPGTTRWPTLPAGRLCAATTSSSPTSCSVTVPPSP